MNAYTHSFQNATLVIGGSIIEGFKGGEAISLSPDGESGSVMVGADKSATFVTQRVAYTLAFTLQAGSPSNNVLNAIMKGRVPVPFSLTETGNTGTRAIGFLIVGTQPAFEIADGDATGRAYEFACDLTSIEYAGA